MLLAVGVIFKQTGSLREVQAKRDLALQEVETAKLIKVKLDAQGLERKYAATEASDMEQTLFLNDIRARATKFSAVITNWKMLAEEYGSTANDGKAVTNADPKSAELLKGITRISSTLSVSGDYNAIRGFLGDLVASDRLYNLSRVSWNRSKDPRSTSTDVIVTVARYVAPSKAASTPAKGS